VRVAASSLKNFHSATPRARFDQIEPGFSFFSDEFDERPTKKRRKRPSEENG
jgi:hypothetical protein